MKALIITTTKTEVREFDDIFEFVKGLKKEFKWFVVSFKFDKEFDLEVWAWKEVDRR